MVRANFHGCVQDYMLSPIEDVWGREDCETLLRQQWLPLSR